jgi:hypothetical protein
MIHANSKTQNNDQLRRAEDIIANSNERRNSVIARQESLEDEVSRLSVSKHVYSKVKNA